MKVTSILNTKGSQVATVRPKATIATIVPGADREVHRVESFELHAVARLEVYRSVALQRIRSSEGMVPKGGLAGQIFGPSVADAARAAYHTCAIPRVEKKGSR